MFLKNHRQEYFLSPGKIRWVSAHNFKLPESRDAAAIKKKQNKNLGTAAGSGSGEGWKPDPSAMEGKEHQKDGEHWGYFFFSGQMGEIPLCVAEQGQRSYKIKSFSPHPSSPSWLSPGAAFSQPRIPKSKELHKSPGRARRWNEGRRARGLGETQEGRGGKVSCPGSCCSRVRTAERPGVTPRGSQGREEPSPGESLVSL